MAFRDDILIPIGGEDRAGADLYYDPVYDRIKKARRINSDPRADRGGDGKRFANLFPANPDTVIALAGEALATRSKDLQLTVWLAEALTWSRHFEGLREGLEILKALLEEFWESLYPKIADGLELRVTPLDWLGSYFDPAKDGSPCLAVRLCPATGSGLTWLDYQEVRQIGYRGGSSDGELPERRKEFDESVRETKKEFYRERAQELAACVEALAQLDSACKNKFAKDGPSFGELRTALGEIQNFISILLAEKLKQEPDLPQVVAGETRAEPEPRAGQPAAEAGSFEPANAEEARLRIMAAAHFLRRQNPAHPSSYLILRGLRWGELQAHGAKPDESSFVAPGTTLRRKIRALAQGAQWEELLHTAEEAMALEPGRAWLDLQRYTVTACQQLGYQPAAKAIRSAVLQLLQDYPDLLQTTFPDDTGLANPDTVIWLREEPSKT